MDQVLVTGAAGFIGFHTARRLLADGISVLGFDNLNSYYDPALKTARIAELETSAAFRFMRADLEDFEAVADAVRSVDSIVHLAAQAGVRYSLEAPQAYIQSNISGFLNILEACRRHPVRHLVYASSSSVYGLNQETPFSTKHHVDQPASLYAATKRANELMAHVYSHLFELPTTGLRFFTVYGPWGRPDMAPFLFADAILKGEPIKVFNHGEMERDFTYVDDIVDGIVGVLGQPPNRNSLSGGRVPYAVFNIGNGRPVSLLRFIELMEGALGRTTRKVMLPMQPGDVPVTYADTTELVQEIGVVPKTPLEEGILSFAKWFREYYGR